MTCATVELDFLHITTHVYRYPLEDAQDALAQIRQNSGGYVADCPPSRLASWSTSTAKTTDACLCQLATAHGMQLATFGSAIKDSAAFLIS